MDVSQGVAGPRSRRRHCMTSPQSVRLQAIFDHAVTLNEPERRTFLAQACAGDASLLAEVASLLVAHDRAGDFLEAPVFAAAPGLFVDEPSESSEPQCIGPY